MNVKEAIDVLERNCDFHYEETDKCYGCKFENSGWCDEDFHDSLLALLKEQEAVKRTCRTGNNGFSIIWTCGACGSDLHPNNAKAKYCSNCGKAVKWND